ncbi:hypothetical protein PPSIR1_29273 [Plesiocystis pacifica SIR-1]|uniref:Lipoprotein n=1 Tax=Plesiocystis pacifica SIR-1 TaxID=391625 RepID=A6G622_9BACT|nr:hypothetical protein PPSIR1_29273 [Plesiocystis pacifica SIR-1]
MVGGVKPHARLALSALVAASLLACEPYDGPKAKPGIDPSSEREVQWPAEAKPRPKLPKVQPAMARAPESTPVEPPADPALAGQKEALAGIGRAALDALRGGKLDDLVALTPLAEGPLEAACAERELPNTAEELKARFDFCRREIDFDKLADAKILASRPTGQPAQGCSGGLEDYGRLQMYLTLEDDSIHRVEFYGAIGKDGEVVGIDGPIMCKAVDAIPASR